MDKARFFMVRVDFGDKTAPPWQRLHLNGDSLNFRELMLFKTQWPAIPAISVQMPVQIRPIAAEGQGRFYNLRGCFHSNFTL
jgi:hypothetical protein